MRLSSGQWQWGGKKGQDNEKTWKIFGKYFWKIIWKIFGK